MIRWAGIALLAIAAIHLVMTFVLFGDRARNIAQSGLFGGLDWSWEGRTAYWFALLSWPIALLGYLILKIEARLGQLPGRTVIAWSLIGATILSGLIQPVSGLWAMMIPGLLLLIRGRADG